MRLVPAAAILLVSVVATSLLGCATVSSRYRAEVSTGFTQSAVMSLQVGMSQATVADLFGKPTTVEVTTCGSQTASSWQCEIWDYELPGDSRGKYTLIPNTNRFYFTRDGALNNWSTDLIYPDPTFKEVQSLCPAGDTLLHGEATAAGAVECFFTAIERGDIVAMARLFGTRSGLLANRDSPKEMSIRLEALRCVIVTSSNECVSAAAAVLRTSPAPTFSYAVISSDGARARMQVVRTSDGRVFPVAAVRSEAGDWFVERIGLF